MEFSILTEYGKLEKNHRKYFLLYKNLNKENKRTPY